MKEPVFTGVATAIVTPFLEDGIHYPVLFELIDRQLAAGISAIVLCGTTGEASTLREEEQLELIQRGSDYIAGRAVVIAGTGSNCTSHAIELTTEAAARGADAALIVTPYYNKATKAGLIRHYTAIADASKIPIIAYNVPSRTGVNMDLSVYEALALHPRINGVKEASGDIAKVSRIIGQLGDSFYVWSGNDDQNTAITALGGKGAISVLSNICPFETHLMVDEMLRGNAAGSAGLQNKMMPLIDALFCEVNPIPVKEALSMMGFEGMKLRLPLCAMSQESRTRLKTELIHRNIIATA